MSVRTTALVFRADAPARGGRWGGNPGTVRILVDAGSGPVLVGRSFRLNAKRWLVAGMEVSVTVDPSNLDGFEIDWDAVPSIEERVAANDPTLADPIGTARRVADAVRAAGLPELSVGGADSERFDESMEKAARAPAQPGTARAVVLITTIRGSIDSDRPGFSSIEGKCPAVLAVNVPGTPAYAVFDAKFKVPRGKWDVAGGGLPALVSSSDPNDVEVLWAKLPSLESQVGDRIVTGIEAAQAQASEMEGQMMDAIQKAMSSSPGAAPGLGAMPGMQDAMARNAKMVLQNIKDPAQRKMLIEQYKAAGVPLDEEDQQP